MKLVWSESARQDLDRLHDFLARHDIDLADSMLDRFIDGANSLRDFPRRGQRLSRFQNRAVHEFRIGHYLVRYELRADALYLLRCFHAREERF